MCSMVGWAGDEKHVNKLFPTRRLGCWKYFFLCGSPTKPEKFNETSRWCLMQMQTFYCIDPLIQFRTESLFQPLTKCIIESNQHICNASSANVVNMRLPKRTCKPKNRDVGGLHLSRHIRLKHFSQSINSVRSVTEKLPIPSFSVTMVTRLIRFHDF